MKKELMKKFKNERGLTLVELLAVIVILAIVSAIAFVMIGNVIENSKKDAHIANAQQIIASAKLYDVTEGIEEGSVESTALQSEGYLDKLVNPWTTDDETYKGTVKKSEKDGVVSFTVSVNGKDLKCNIGDGTTEEKLAIGRDDGGVCGKSDE